MRNGLATTAQLVIASVEVHVPHRPVGGRLPERRVVELQYRIGLGLVVGSGVNEDLRTNRVLAEIDGRQISDYESDNVIPSTDIVVRMARAFGVSVVYLLIDDAPRIAVRPEDAELLRAVNQLTEQDLGVVRTLIDAFITKHKFRQLAAG